ncbi:MAG: hypothetical protein AAF747_03930 [Planctomycetota bacterium]
MMDLIGHSTRPTVWGAVAAVALGAASVAVAQPTSTELFEAHVEAVDGDNIRAEHDNRVTYGEFMPPDGSGPVLFTIWQQREDQLRYSLENPGLIGGLTRGFDGETGWEVSGAGLRMIETDSEEYSELVFGSEFDGENAWETLYTEHEYVGERTFRGQAVHEISATSKTGREFDIFFSVETGIIVGKSSTRNGGSIVFTFEDYTDFGGILVPTVQRQIDQSGETVVRFRHIRYNVDEADMPQFTTPEIVASESDSGLGLMPETGGDSDDNGG